MRRRRAELHEYLQNKLKNSAVRLSSIDNKLPIEVHVLRPSVRTDWEGRPRFQWVIELTQRIGEYLDPDDAKVKDKKPDYYFRGGCTLLVDELLGQQQVVAKSLCEGLGKVQGVAGAAILGDGHVGLILDPAEILALARTMAA